MHGSPGILGCTVITERVHPNEVLKNTMYNNATAFFIESRNVRQVPARLDGVLCAVFLSCYNVERKKSMWCWRLCLIHRYVHERDCLQLLVWSGDTCDGVPRFFHFDSYDGPRSQSYISQFYYKQVVSQHHTVVFLNQVSGIFLQPNKTMADCVNKDDDCFQCDPNGPDYIIIPRKRLGPDIELTKDIGSAFPQLFNTKPRVPFTHASPPKADIPFIEYRRLIKKPDVEFNRRKYPRQKRCKAIPVDDDGAQWVDPPQGFSFQRKDMHFTTVYVEDSPGRLLVEPADHDLVGIPVIETVKE